MLNISFPSTFLHKLLSSLKYPRKVQVDQRQPKPSLDQVLPVYVIVSHLSRNFLSIKLTRRCSRSCWSQDLEHRLARSAFFVFDHGPFSLLPAASMQPAIVQPSPGNGRGDHTSCINFEFLLLTPCKQQASNDHNSLHLPKSHDQLRLSISQDNNLLNFVLRTEVI